MHPNDPPVEPVPVDPNVPTDLTPIRKVSAAGVGGAAATVIIFILTLLDVDVPPEAAAGLAALLAFGAGYMTPSV